MSIWLKICGLTRSEDVRSAAALQVDAVGFIFVPASPRYVSPARAAELIALLPPQITPVGVFVNASCETILDAVRVAGIRIIQLHGEESPEFAADLPLPVIKAFRTGPTFHQADVCRYGNARILIDGYRAGQHGGTGTRADWSEAAAISKSMPVILSGGLTSGNVGAAIQTVRPHGIDVSSGVERAPGVKDPVLMERFVRAVRKAEIKA